MALSRPISALAKISLLLVLGLALSGCVTLNDPEAAQEFRADIVASPQAGERVGQTLVSRRPRLNGVQLWLNINLAKEPEQFFQVSLYHQPGDEKPLVNYRYKLSSLTHTNPLTITFPPIADPPGQSYYLEMTSTSGSFLVFGRLEDAYSAGQLYLQGNPQPSDLSFRLTYDYDLPAMASDGISVVRSAWLILPLLAILWLPGWLLIQQTRLRHRLDPVERICVSLGLSLAIIPTIMLWTSTLGLHWSRPIVIAVACLSGIICIVQILSSAIRRRRPGISQPPNSTSEHQPGSRTLYLAIGVVFVISLAVRLAMIRDLATPAWVDSVHHATLIRLITEQGAFPNSYAPYLDVQTASYHAGFHSLVAVFQWLSGLDLPQAMLILGQVLNACSILAVYLFTVTFTNNKLAGVLAALVAGLFTPMPAYYTSWGRYTQLAGILILPTILVLGKEFINRHSEKSLTVTVQLLKNRSSVHNSLLELFLLSLACTGLFLTHYRVIVFLGGLCLACTPFVIYQIIRNHDFRQKTRSGLFLIILVGVSTILLTLPWWPGMITTLLIPNLALQSIPVKLFADFNWAYLTTALGKYATWLAGIGLIWGLIQRQWFPIILTLWVGILFGIANLGAWQLPGASFINNTSVEITLFLPIALACGYLFSWLIQGWNAVFPLPWRRLYQGVILIGLIIASIHASKNLLPILNPVTILTRQADLIALDWLEQNVPLDETVLINAIPWGFRLFAGSDGGYWITPLTGRKTMPPPLLYGLDFAVSEMDRIADICRQAASYNHEPESLHTWLINHNIHYIYLGAHSGAFSAQELRTSVYFDQLYDQAGVTIFRVANK